MHGVIHLTADLFDGQVDAFSFGPVDGRARLPEVQRGGLLVTVGIVAVMAVIQPQIGEFAGRHIQEGDSQRGRPDAWSCVRQELDDCQALRPRQISLDNALFSRDFLEFAPPHGMFA